MGYGEILSVDKNRRRCMDNEYRIKTQYLKKKKEKKKKKGSNRQVVPTDQQKHRMFRKSLSSYKVHELRKYRKRDSKPSQKTKKINKQQIMFSLSMINTSKVKKKK